MAHLSNTIIDKALQRAEQVICSPNDETCCSHARPAAEALAEITPSGWCKIGLLVKGSTGEVWDAWYNLQTAQGRLKRQVEPIEKQLEVEPIEKQLELDFSQVNGGGG
jgi:hypothetical protein